MFTIDYRSSLSKCNIILNMFNSVAKTIDYKQLILYLAAILLTEDKIAFNVNSFSLVKIIKAL